MNSEIIQDPLNNKLQLIISLGENEIKNLVDGNISYAQAKIANQIADTIYEKYSNEIIARLDLDKIARIVENNVKMRIIRKDLKLVNKKK